MDWFWLALISAFSLATSDAFTKKYFPTYSGWELLIVRFFVPGMMLLPVTLSYDYSGLPGQFWIWIAILVPLELLAMSLYLLAIRDSPLHLSLPYLAFTPVFNVVTGDLILGESVSAEKLLGIILVVFGAYLLNLKKNSLKNLKTLFTPLKSIVTERGSRLMLIAAIIYSLTSVLSKGAMQYFDSSYFGAFYFSIIGFCALVMGSVMKPGSYRILQNHPVKSLFVGGAMAVMVVTHFLAIELVQVAYMITVKRTSLLFGILYGAILFREKHVLQHFVAGALMVTGVAVILI